MSRIDKSIQTGSGFVVAGGLLEGGWRESDEWWCKSLGVMQILQNWLGGMVAPLSECTKNHWIVCVPWGV